MMDRKELLKYHDHMCHAAKELMKKKNHDYCGKIAESSTTPNPFANFCRCEHMGICTTEAGFLVRLTDKFSRLSSFCEQGMLKVEDEKIDDTLQDIINYSILFGAYLESKKDKEGYDKRKWQVEQPKELLIEDVPQIVMKPGAIPDPSNYVVQENDPNANATSAGGIGWIPIAVIVDDDLNPIKDSNNPNDINSVAYEPVAVRETRRSGVTEDSQAASHPQQRPEVRMDGHNA